ncbi:MAG: patatin-like phospholipase family protein [Sinobacteraceae bacterium]|nr:patatin-like phospholipase family protein [Nevskiaceae bacterium]
MNSRDILKRCALFSALDPAALAQLATSCTELELTGGTQLCHTGDAADALYVVATGHLRASFDSHHMSQDIGRFGSIGGIGIFSGGGYGAHVRAVRDSRLLCIKRSALLDFVQAQPAAMLAITRKIIERQRGLRVYHGRTNARQHRTFAVVPATPHINTAAVAKAMADALEKMAPTELITAARVDQAIAENASETELGDGPINRQVVDYLNQVESETSTGYLVYTANRVADAWSRRCMREADRILVIVRASEQPQATAMVRDIVEHHDTTHVVLVVLRDLAEPAGDLAGWLAQLETRTHYFVRSDAAGDYASLARQLTGRGLALVLGGGGARGFAHLGLLRALDELHLSVDLAAGTSMGAFVGALLACQFSRAEAEQLTRDTFVSNNYINDYTLPRVSLIRGRKLLTHLREVFGQRRIETLRMPYFCVTTNLTRGQPYPHDRGELALWVAASMAIPGIAPPLVWNGELHVDGSVVNSLPTDIMQEYGRGPIIGSDVSTVGTLTAPGIEGPDPEALLKRSLLDQKISLFDILFSTATLTSETGVKMRAKLADCYLRMPLEGIGLFDWKRMDEIVSIGYEHAMKNLEPMVDVLAGRAEPDIPQEDATPTF